MAIREGRWDCPSCGSTGIYGRHVDCPGCNKPRPAGIRFYLTEDAPVITDPERLREARAGADWVCEHCGASNRATEDNCLGCGAIRGTSPAQRVTDYDLTEVPRSGEDDDRPRALADTPKGSGKKTSVAQGCGGCGCLLLILAMVMSAIASLGDPPVGGADLTPAQVQSKFWERSILVEQRRLVDGEGWELPDSAQNVRRQRRFHHNDEEIVGYRSVTRDRPRTERVSDGTETHTREVEERVRTGTRTYVCGQRDLGNGYFEDIECSEPVYETRTRTESWSEPRYRDVTTYETVTEQEPITRPVPVYQTFYRYRIPEWTVVDTLQAKGYDDRPLWPDTTGLRRNQRLGQRSHRYTLTVREAGGLRRTFETGIIQWQAWRPRQRVALRNSTQGGQVQTFILPADSLYECRLWHRDRKRPPGDTLGGSPPPPRPAGQ